MASISGAKSVLLDTRPPEQPTPHAGFDVPLSMQARSRCGRQLRKTVQTEHHFAERHSITSLNVSFWTASAGLAANDHPQEVALTG